jgi:hypothetical protein
METFHAEDLQASVANMQNIVARTTWNPGFVHTSYSTIVEVCSRQVSDKHCISCLHGRSRVTSFTLSPQIEQILPYKTFSDFPAKVLYIFLMYPTPYVGGLSHLALHDLNARNTFGEEYRLSIKEHLI